MLKFLNFPLIQMCRVDHWFKNIFVLPGMVIAIFLTNKNLTFLDYTYLMFNMLSICLMASANYLINEYLDSPYDKFHPIKKNRASVKMSVRLQNVIILYLLIILASLFISINSNQNFIFTLVLFGVLGLLYNVKPLRLKDRPYLDILSESLNNPTRLLLGWSSIENNFLPPISIFLCFWMGGAFLMTVKRFAELRHVKQKILVKYRATFKYYSENILLLKSFFYALMACFFLGIFLIKYRIEYLILFPLISLLFTYYLYLGLKKFSITQTPEKLFKSKKLVFITILIVLIFIFTTIVDIDILKVLVEPINYEIFKK